MPIFRYAEEVHIITKGRTLALRYDFYDASGKYRYDLKEAEYVCRESVDISQDSEGEYMLTFENDPDGHVLLRVQDGIATIIICQEDQDERVLEVQNA